MGGREGERGEGVSPGAGALISASHVEEGHQARDLGPVANLRPVSRLGLVTSPVAVTNPVVVTKPGPVTNLGPVRQVSQEGQCQERLGGAEQHRIQGWHREGIQGAGETQPQCLNSSCAPADSCPLDSYPVDSWHVQSATDDKDAGPAEGDEDVGERARARRAESLHREGGPRAHQNEEHKKHWHAGENASARAV